MVIFSQQQCCPALSLLRHCAGKDQIERLLSMGATRMEATADLVGRSIKLAMTPLLNTMSVVGLVSIPGVHKQRAVRTCPQWLVEGREGTVDAL